MTGWIGITLGDVTGIGPEVALKAVAAEAGRDDTHYLLIGDADTSPRLNQKLSAQFAAEKIHRPWRLRPVLHHQSIGRTAAGKFACRFAGRGACRRRLLARWRRTLPPPRTGRPGHRAGQQGIHHPRRPQIHRPDGISLRTRQARRTAMMLLGQDERGRWLRVALATIHFHQIGA